MKFERGEEGGRERKVTEMRKSPLVVKETREGRCAVF